MYDSRPNIALFMTDQQRGDCLGIEGHPVLQTPYLDLEEDPRELTNLVGDAQRVGEIAEWRARLVQELDGRPEGFTDGERLTPIGGPSPRYMPGHERPER